MLDGLCHATIADIRVLPICSVEWSSELRIVRGVPIIILDLEQINALSYVVYRELCSDRPIFHYCEYMIRAAEMLIALGQPESALRVAQLGHNRLAEYSRMHRAYPLIPRPINVSALDPLAQFLGDVLVAFVMGHEMGHVVAARSSELDQALKAVEKCWSDHQVKSWSWGDGPSTNRYVVPSLIQKFDDYGMPSGHLSITSARLRALDQELKLALEECKADFLGLLACSRLAATKSVAPSHLAHMLIVTLCATDRYCILRRVLPQIPRGRRRGAVDFEYSRVSSRLFLLTRMILLIADDAVPVPSDIRSYWNIDQTSLESWRAPTAEKYIDHVTLGNDAVARGGVYLGSGAEFPTNLPSEAEILEQYGNVAGPLQMPLYWPFRMPIETYSIASHWSWSGEGIMPGLVGFASAIRDITAALMDTSVIRDECGVNYRRRSRQGHDILKLVRRARACIEQQSLAIDFN